MALYYPNSSEIMINFGHPFTPSYVYRNPLYKPKTVWRPSQVYNDNLYIHKTASSQWIVAQYTDDLYCILWVYDDIINYSCHTLNSGLVNCCLTQSLISIIVNNTACLSFTIFMIQLNELLEPAVYSTTTWVHHIHRPNCQFSGHLIAAWRHGGSVLPNVMKLPIIGATNTGHPKSIMDLWSIACRNITMGDYRDIYWYNVETSILVLDLCLL